MSWHDSIHDAFHRPTTRIHQVVEALVWTLILASVALFFVELLLELSEHSTLKQIDHVILWIFAGELALRVLSYRPPKLALYRRTLLWRLRAHVVDRVRFLFQPLTLIDLLTVLALVGPLRMLRALRLLRLLRAGRVFRYASPIQDLVRTFGENALLFHVAFGLLAVSVLVGGVTFYLAEGPLAFKAGDGAPSVSSISDAIWWALVTITTVGYGDITPATLQGKVIGGVMMVLGMFTLALFAGIVGSTLLGAVLKLRREQFRMSNRSNHVVLCGFDPESRLLHDVALKEFNDQRTELVLFSVGDRPASVPPEFTWIGGDPTKESELDKARIQDAAAVIIAGSRKVRPQQADAQTILIVFTIRSWMRKHDYAKDRRRPLYIIAEILETENVEHARTAGADEVIETPRLGLSLMAHSVTERGAGEIMTSVALSGAHNLYIGKSPVEKVMPYHDLAREITERHGVTVLGLQDATRVELSPEGSTPVDADRGVIYLASKPVLEPYHLGEGEKKQS